MSYPDPTKIYEDDEMCAYCGENKWENKQKHLDEVSEFLKKHFEKLLNN